MKTLVKVTANEDLSFIEISETGTKQGCHRIDADGFEELDFAETMVIPFNDKVVTKIRIAWRKNSTDTWKLYTNATMPQRYTNNLLVTDRSIYCTTEGVFCTKEEAMVELLDEEGNGFDPIQYSTTEYNEGYTNFYDYWDISVGVAIKAGIGVGMMARD
jgi:hypothetical protein